MHGDKMKEIIKIKYRTIFKYEEHQEVVKFDEKGYLEKLEDCQVISFKGDSLIKIKLRQDEVVLHNGDSILRLALDCDVLNDYQTEFGSVSLTTRLVQYEIGNTIKIKYELYDGNSLVSNVYMMLSYWVLEN